MVEDLGYATFLTGDHLGAPSPLVRLVSAAEATSTLRVGSFVLNNDFHRPLLLAREAATVDALTGGRLEFGIGTGWAKPEYDLLGISYERPSVRARRLAAALTSIKQAWAGQVGGASVPPALLPRQSPHPPVLVGGQSDAVLSVAARHADIVGFMGMTLHQGSFRFAGSAEALAERVDHLRSVAGDRFARLELNVHVDAVFLAGNAESIVDKVAALHGVAPRIVRDSPFVLIGDRERLVDKLHAVRERIGVTYYVVSHKICESLAPVVARLAGR